jgi:hypothetical protein
MTALNYANLWSSALTGAITNSALSCGVISTTGSPAVPFRARIRAEGANKDEIVTVTAKTGTLTIVRAAEAIGDGTHVAQAHASGATIEAVLTAGLLDQLARPTIRHAAGVPSGAPALGELPIAVDSTSSPGNWYFWSGTAWTR